MKRIILIFLGLFSLAYGQFSNTGAKTRFVNGISIGTKLDSYFNSADSNAIYWRADSVVMAKYRGTARALSFIDDTAFLTNRFIRLQMGNLYRQTGKAWVSDTIYTSGVLRADSHLRTDSIRSSVSTGFSGQINVPNNTGYASRSNVLVPGLLLDIVNITALDTLELGNSALPSVVYSGKPVMFTSSTGGYRTVMPNASGTIALTSNVTDSASALRASINTKLNISDTAAMLAGVSLDRVLANGNTSGRAATVGAFTASTGYFSSNLTSAARIRSDKAFFNTSSTGATDTVVSVVSAAAGPAMVVQNSNGQAIKAQGSVTITSTGSGILNNALDLISSSNQRFIRAFNGTNNVFDLLNNGDIVAGGGQFLGTMSINNNRRFYTNYNDTTTSAFISAGGSSTGSFYIGANNGLRIIMDGSYSLKPVTDYAGSLGTTGSTNNRWDTVNARRAVLSSQSISGLTTSNTLSVGHTASSYPFDVRSAATGNYAAYIQNTVTTAGQSSGLFINAGTNGSDRALNINDAANLNGLFAVLGNGTLEALPTYSVTVGGTNRDLFIDNTGIIGYVSSFRASKKNIVPMTGTSWLHKLNPVTFNYRVKDSLGNYTDSTYKELEYGLIAEEVEPINKEMVFYDVDSTGKHLRGVHYSKLIIPLLKEIQDQKKTITDLEARVAKLEELIKLIKP